MSIVVDKDLADAIDEAVVQLRKARRKEHTPSTPEQLPQWPHARKGFSHPWNPPSPAQRPFLQFATPLFLPAEARKVLREELVDLTVSVDVTLPPTEAKPRLVAENPARRQQRRKTWRERLRYNALPEGAEIVTNLHLQRDSPWLMTLYGPAQTRAAV